MDWSNPKINRWAKEFKLAGYVRLGAFAGAGAGALGIVAMDWPMAVALACVVLVAVGMSAGRSMKILRLRMRDAALAELNSQQQADRDRELLEEERRQEVIAGIEFDTPSGVFDGKPVFRFALKNGRRYEYSGLAHALDEPGEDKLIVNDFIYELVPST